MGRVTIRYLLTFILLLLGSSVTAQVEHNMTGNLSVDLDSKKSIRQNTVMTSSIYDLNAEEEYVRRTLSSHVLQLGFTGPLVSANFGSYLLKGKFSGAFYSRANEGNNFNEYINFDMTGMESAVYLFSQRRYPLTLYRNSSTDYSIKDEPSLRTEQFLLRPSLHFVRRYDGDRTSYGADWSWNVRKNVDFKASYKVDETDKNRFFDAGEDLDLFVNIIPLRLHQARDTIEIINELSDADLVVQLGVEILNLPALTTDTIIVDSGSYSFSITPSVRYNSFPDTTLYIKDNMRWKILNIEPASPNDISQKTSGGNFSLVYDNQQNMKNETILDVSTMEEDIQVLKTDLMNLNNRLDYVLNNDMDLNFTTTYTTNESKIDTLFPQTNNLFNHVSSYTWSKRNKINMLLSHSYSHTKSETGTIDEDTLSSVIDTTLNILTSDNHIITSKTAIPYRPLNYIFEVRTNFNMLTDNSQYANNQYSFEAFNKLTRKVKGIKFTPRTQSKFLINRTTLPDSMLVDSTQPVWDTLEVFTSQNESKELENKLFLTGEFTGNRYLGDVKITGEFDYRKKYDSVGSDIKKKYILDAYISKKIGNKAKISFITNQERETYGGTTPSTFIPPEGVGSPKSNKGTMKFDIQYFPATGYMITANYMLINQTGYKYTLKDASLNQYKNSIGKTNIKKIGLSFNFLIPYINFPIKTIYTSEKRDISSQDVTSQYAGDFSSETVIADDLLKLPEQTTTKFEAKVNYSFRKISVVMHYELSKEVQATNTFKYYEITAKVMRQFGIY